MAPGAKNVSCAVRDVTILRAASNEHHNAPLRVTIRMAAKDLEN